MIGSVLWPARCQFDVDFSDVAHAYQPTPEHRSVTGSVVRPNSRAVSDVKVTLFTAEPSGEIVATTVSDRRGAFSMKAPAGRRYVVVGTIGNERGEVGPFELTAATAPILIVLRKKS